ncbi:MAG: class I SAM-dependent methyltransferase, partial [Candidatus Eremiobacteraeota bacterium]|nr:class I SAM-dependent methyltransferase [Candidatus Eremiobacteraeota bacterium]
MADRQSLEAELSVLDDVASRYELAQDFDIHQVRFFGEWLLPRVRGTSCLEVGCGDGSMSEILVDAVARLDIVDASTKYLRQVEAKLGTRVTLHQAFFESFEPLQRYETIVCAHVLEHVLDPCDVLARMREWLAPHGRLFVLVPNALSF